MADSETPAAEPATGKRWLVPVVALLLGSAGAVGVAKADAIKSSLGLVPAVAAAESDVPTEFGAFAQLDGIVVNPAGTDGRRYLMVKIGVEAESEKTLARLNELQPAAIDGVIDVLSNLGVEELTDITRRDSLKETVRQRFNAMLGDDGPVSRIYFTQYVLQ